MLKRLAIIGCVTVNNRPTDPSVMAHIEWKTSKILSNINILIQTACVYTNVTCVIYIYIYIYIIYLIMLYHFFSYVHRISMDQLIMKIILSFYSLFSGRVCLSLHNIPSPGVLMKSIGAEMHYNYVHTS